MPDLLDELRRYGEAVEHAAITRQTPTYPASPAPARRRPSRALVLIGAAVVVLVLIVVSVAANRTDPRDDVHIDTPPISVAPALTALPPTTIATEPLPDLSRATTIEPSSTTWSRLDPGPLTWRSAAAVQWTGDQVIIWGGYGDSQSGPSPELDDGASYNPDSNTWNELPAAPIAGRALAVNAWTGTEMLIWGGGGGNTDWASHTDGAAYNPTTRTWRTLPPAPLPAGPLYSGTWIGNRLMIVGASDTGIQSATYDPVSDVWQVLQPIEVTLSTPGTQLDVTWSPPRVVVVEAFPLGGPTQAVIYDPSANTWSVSRPQGFGSRAVSTAALDRQVYLISYSQDSDGTASVDPMTGQWDGPTVISDDLSCEGSPTVVSIRHELFATSCGRSGIYTPTTRTWQPTTTPAELSAEAVIWTGNELLWWGTSSDTPTRTTGLWDLPL